MVRQNLETVTDLSSITTNFGTDTLRPVNSAKFSEKKMAQKAEQKLTQENDIQGALRLLCSNDTVADYSEDTYLELQTKHPSEPAEATLQNTHNSQLNNEEEEDDWPHETQPKEVTKAIMSFKPGSASGLDGFSPQHAKDLISKGNAAAAESLIKAFCKLIDLMLFGKIPTKVREYLYGASLIALIKKTGGIRPIAIGSVYRRIAAKIACNRIKSNLSAVFRPNQLGFGTPMGAEAVTHATRQFIEARDKCVILKLDFKNAFNSVYRNAVIHSVQINCPTLMPFVLQCYKDPTYLMFGEHPIRSESGVQQGDPLGPLLFCASIHQDIVLQLQSPLNIWYLDDGTIGGSPDEVLGDLQLVIAAQTSTGLALNAAKCELFIRGYSQPEEEHILRRFNSTLSGISQTHAPKLELLGAPLTDEAIPTILKAKNQQVATMCRRLKHLSAHSAFFLLKNCIGIPKLNYFLRTCPAYKFLPSLREIDDCLRHTTERILNVTMTDETWRQTSLPTAFGGLGVRRTEELALPAFLASSIATAPTVSQILRRATSCTDPTLDHALLLWDTLNPGNQRPLAESATLQKSWDWRSLKTIHDSLIDTATNPNDRARLLAAARPESGIWLDALPSKTIGTYLENSEISIAIGLRLGTQLCIPHVCKCGAAVDEYGRHGLSCKESTGRQLRHDTINDLIHRSIISAGRSAQREPTHLASSNGLRPDGITIQPWKLGKQLVWDATCSCTFAPSYEAQSSREAGLVAAEAEKRKHQKYESLTNRFLFRALAFETTGVFSKDSIKTTKEIGKLLAEKTGEPRSTYFLRQRISVAIQRGNAKSILGTVLHEEDLHEIFYI